MGGWRPASPERRGGSGDRIKKSGLGLKEQKTKKRKEKKNNRKNFFSFPGSQQIDEETEDVALSALPPMFHLIVLQSRRSHSLWLFQTL